MEQRVEKLRAMLEREGLDAFLVLKPENRAYISGFTGSSAYIVVSQDRALLFTDFRYVEQAKQQCPGFTVIDYRRELAKTLNKYLQEAGVSVLGFEKQYVTYGLYQDLQEKLDVTLEPTAGLVEELRTVKDQQEIELMQKAQEIAEQAFEHVLTIIKPGITENEVALELEFKMRRLGAEGLAFPTIAASGVRSALPHGRASNKVLEKGDFLTLDFGAVYQGYCSDMTRTVVLGEPTDKQREVYNTVLKAQLAALEAAGPGITGRELDAVARDIITEAGYSEYFGHGLGHGVGRQVHEAPGAGPRSDGKLVPGHIVTIEPGIYIPGWGGVRIEDMILITENGYQNFNSSTKELIIL